MNVAKIKLDLVPFKRDLENLIRFFLDLGISIIFGLSDKCPELIIHDF